MKSGRMMGLVRNFLAGMILFCSAIPAFAMSPRVEQCATMVSIAQLILETQGKEDPTRAGLKDEEAQYRFVRQFGLAPAHVDFLDGLVRMVFMTKLKATRIDDALIELYARCARGGQ
jgi:hypothetical protein